MCFSVSRMYYEEWKRRVTDTEPYELYHRRNVEYVPHIHEELEVGYVVSGTVRYGNERYEKTLNAGDIFISMPDEIHYLVSASPSAVDVFRILPKQNDRVDFSGIRLHQNCIRPDHPAYADLSTSFLQMVKEFDGNEEGRDIALRKCRYEIFLIILRQMSYARIYGEERQRLAGQTMLLRSVNDYISEHYSDPISLDEIADYCGYSKYYFAHCIKEITGSTFLDFLMMYRLSLACTRLRDGDGTVTEIALDCGFNNLRAFNRSFRKYYNTTPSEYRKRALEE